MKLYKFYSPDPNIKAPADAFKPDKTRRLLGWTKNKKYRKWFTKSRNKDSYREIVTDVDEDSEEWEVFQLSSQEQELIPKSLKSDNNAVIGVVMSREVENMLVTMGISDLKLYLQDVFNIRGVPPLNVFTNPMQKALRTVSYDIICDTLRDTFSLEIEGLRGGRIPEFWYFLFLEYPNINVDGTLDVSDNILKYINDDDDEDDD